MSRDPVSAFLAGFNAVDQYETNKLNREMAPVSEEQEIEVSIAPPPPFGPPGQLPFAGGPPEMAPPHLLAKVKETIIVTEDEFEPTLIREVTIGGVTLLATGELMRTYSGESPSLCPT